MGSQFIPPYKRHGLSVEDREVTEPILYGDGINYNSDDPLDAVCASMVASEMPDIREAAKKIREDGVIGESGAEAFFCDTMQCVKKKDEVLTLCGMENHDDVIEEHINELCEDYKEMHDSVNAKKKLIEKHEKLLEALAVKLGYEHIAFSPDGVTLVKNGITSLYPPKKRRYENWDR